MLISLLLGLLAIILTAYFLHLFFQLNRSEKLLQDAIRDVEASMLQRYGRPLAFKPRDDQDPDSESKSSYDKKV